MTFKTGDKGKTRGGDDYEVVATSNNFGLSWLWVYSNGQMFTHSDDGKVWGPKITSAYDLLPPKQKIEGFLVVHNTGDTYPKIEFYRIHPQRAPHASAIIPIAIEYTEGEGLDA